MQTNRQSSTIDVARDHVRQETIPVILDTEIHFFYLYRIYTLFYIPRHFILFHAANRMMALGFTTTLKYKRITDR